MKGKTCGMPVQCRWNWNGNHRLFLLQASTYMHKTDGNVDFCVWENVGLDLTMTSYITMLIECYSYEFSADMNFVQGLIFRILLCDIIWSRLYYIILQVRHVHVCLWYEVRVTPRYDVYAVLSLVNEARLLCHVLCILFLLYNSERAMICRYYVLLCIPGGWGIGWQWLAVLNNSCAGRIMAVAFVRMTCIYVGCCCRCMHGVLCTWNNEVRGDVCQMI